MQSATAPLALTMGEPGGVSSEITAAAWKACHRASLPFFIIDDPDRYGAYDVPIKTIDTPAQAAACFDKALPIYPLTRPVDFEPGVTSAKTANLVIESIERAVQFCLDGQACGIVTNPIQKSALIEAGFSFPGHTEFLGSLTQDTPLNGPRGPVMMLAGPQLRTVPITVHIALRDVPSHLNTKKIIFVAKLVDHALRTDFGISDPKIAIAGLNPHAGEAGAFGDEDQRIIAPAVETLSAAGINVRGPAPADTLFHAQARNQYDAALCMYHDQALIPVKTLDFDRTVNVTLGLPIVRTSPDHGSALDIAGKGVANPASLIAAIEMAGTIVRNRANTDER